MKKLLTGFIAGAFALVLLAPAAIAQTTGTTKVVGTCGTATYSAGKMAYPTQDVTGLACGSATFSGSFTVSNAFALETTQVLNNTALNAIVAGLANNVPVVGAAASGASVSGNPVLDGCRAATAAPTAVTDGQAVARQCDAYGGIVTSPYGPRDVWVRGSTGATTTNTQVSIIASAGGSLKNYITAIQCSNSGASTSILTFTDANATVLINPATGGGQWTFPVPLATAAATAFQVTFGTASTSQYCSAQGFKAP